jgi:hypothetical protein
MKAVDWAIEDATRNHFTVQSAREAMWRALTLKRIDRTGALVDVPSLVGFTGTGIPGQAEGFREGLRKSYWATTFRALGDVVHLLQDMAQPQHTRNDPHTGLGCRYGACSLGHASYYEKYIDARVSGDAKFNLRERLFGDLFVNNVSVDIVSAPPTYAGYPIPNLDAYEKFFSSGTSFQSTTGIGLANYSNQGFYSFGTNIGESDYPSPPINPNDPLLRYVPPPGGVVLNNVGQPISGSMQLVRGRVADSLNPGLTDSDVALSTFSVFDQFLLQAGRRAQFSLNHYNYDDQARLLIPRAVAYSAGLINYFFRGQMEINLPSAGVYSIADHKMESCAYTCGFRTVKLKVKNTTPSESMSNGFFVAVAKYHQNKSYVPDLSGEPGGPNFAGFDGAYWSYEEIKVSDKVDIATVPGATLASGAETELGFTFAQPIPINATDVSLQVVFRGKLGNETDAVVVETKDIAEPEFLAVSNTTDYVYDAIGRAYRPLPWGGYSAPDTIYSIAVTLGGATGPIATLDHLDGGGHAEIAFLTDKAVRNHLVNYASRNYATFAPISLDLPPEEFVSLGYGSYDATIHVSPARGVYRRIHFFNSYPADGIANCDLQPERCAQATIPVKLTPATASAWQINF